MKRQKEYRSSNLDVGDLYNFEDDLAGISKNFKSALIVYFRHRTKCLDEAEDLCQDVFLRLLKRGRPEEIRSIRGYVFQVANSVWIDSLRHSQSRDANARCPLPQDVPDDAVIGCDRIMLGRENVERVKGKFDELPERTQSIFVLRRLEGKKVREIADDLGVSASTVEKHLLQATMHLRACLDDGP